MTTTSHENPDDKWLLLFFKSLSLLSFIEHTNTLYLQALPQLVGAVPRLSGCCCSTVIEKNTL